MNLFRNRRTAIGVFLAANLVTALVVLYVVVGLDGFLRAAGGCTGKGRFASVNARGDEVEVIDQECPGIAYSSTIQVRLRLKQSGAAAVVFAYGNRDDRPTFAWTGNNDLSIAFHFADKTEVKLTRFEDVNIHYDTQAD